MRLVTLQGRAGAVYVNPESVHCITTMNDIPGCRTCIYFGTHSIVVTNSVEEVTELLGIAVYPPLLPPTNTPIKPIKTKTPTKKVTKKKRR